VPCKKPFIIKEISSMEYLEKQVFGKRKFGVMGWWWSEIVGLIVLFLIIEFQWDVVERWAGSYLEWQNGQRQRTGSAWESYDRTVHAVGKVDTLVGQLKVRESEIESLASLAQVPGLLSPRGGITVSKEQFLRLFQGLPPYLWGEWISAKDLMQLSQQQDWVRSYLWWNGQNLDIYMVNSNNGVLYQRSISGEWLEIAAINRLRQSGMLHDTEEFSRRIYPADDLWSIMESLPDDVVQQLMSSPGLSSGDRLVRVGLSSLVVGDLGIVGLEFSVPEGMMVEEVVLKADDLWDLGMLLERGQAEEEKDEYDGYDW
jgi:hypothetical protein